ncbi:hypothetical protein UYO_1467 [Lachnospiraceae bacterium JC7]|nr:hypothetical protein UYO_1467 [Lachnospiraceae bacterium JC7]
MPLPFILGIAAGVAAVGGIGSGIHGGMKMKEANDTMEYAKRKHQYAIDKFERMNSSTTRMMDSLGTQELEILSGFEHFSDLIEKIQNRPEFKSFLKEGIDIPKYDAQKLKEVSTGAGVLVGGLGGAAAGTAGGFAAAGATTSAVMALGTASTGTAIASLSGAAATNATLAALGGGAIAAGGGGIALGTTILGATTLGVGLLVGGVIFNITGSKLSDQADEAYRQACKTADEVETICAFLSKLENSARKFKRTLTSVEAAYKERLQILDHIVNYEGKTDWQDFSEQDKRTTENLVLLVGMLYKMCQVKLVLNQANHEREVNTKGILDVQMEADLLLDNVA